MAKKVTIKENDPMAMRFYVDDKQRVVLEFGNPVTWIGMTAVQAKTLAQELLKKATEAEAMVYNLERLQVFK